MRFHYVAETGIANSADTRSIENPTAVLCSVRIVDRSFPFCSCLHFDTKLRVFCFFFNTTVTISAGLCIDRYFVTSQDSIVRICVARPCFINNLLITFQKPAMAPTDNAVTTPFGTVELLEQILLCVDMKTLLLSQRVDRMFRDTIADSQKLQEALYFKASDGDPSATSPPLYGANPLLVTRYPFPNSLKFEGGGWMSVELAEIDRRYPNKTRLYEVHHNFDEVSMVKEGLRHVGNCMVHQQDLQRHSYSRMLLQQPSGPGEAIINDEVVWLFKDEITIFGDLLDAVMH